VQLKKSAKNEGKQKKKKKTGLITRLKKWS
jgi:hypothetical protein